MSNSIKQTINDCMSLDIVMHQGQDLELMFWRESEGRKALDDFLGMRISFSELLEVLDFLNVDIDSYLENVDADLKVAGI